MKHTRSFRADAEFFLKQYLNDDKAIAKNGFNKLVKITNKINVGYVGSMVEHYRDDGIVLLQTKNIDAFFINDTSLIKVTPEFHNQLKKSQITNEDILIARSGSFGKASIYLDYNSINTSDIIIVEANKKIINPFFLVTYLNSKFGVNQMIRFSSGGLQGHVNLTILEELEVPIIDVTFQIKIEEIIKLSYDLKKSSKDLYSKAEIFLLQEIGLSKQLANSNLPLATSINVKSFNESFGVTGRLDAEYYQPKYEAIIEKIKSQKYDSLHNIVTITKSIEPGSDYYSDDEIGLPFMRVADYNKFGLSEPNKKLTLEFVKDNQDKIDELKPQKGSILFSKDGSVGTAFHLREDFEGITSSAILNLKVKNEKEIIPEYLTLALNSKLVQMQAERDAGGSIILHWRIGEIQNVIVPIIDYSKQQQIAKLIEESFSLKKQSEHLLEVAKRAVEIAIEENEVIAMKYIDENCGII